MSFIESEERQALRKAVRELGKKYGYAWFNQQARSGGHTTELWLEAGKLGYLGVNLPEEYGGGGGGMADLSIVLEELGAAGCPLLMLVVSPSICGTVIARFGTDEQKQRWLPGLADGTTIMAFAITEPDAGSNSHQITTTARRTERRLVADRAEGLHLRARRRPGRARGRPDRGRPDRQAQAGAVHRPGGRAGGGVPADRDGPDQPGQAVRACSSTTYDCRARRSSAPRTRP